MFRFSRALRAEPPYKTTSFSALLKEHTLTKASTGDFDHIVIDCGPIAGACSRFFKDLEGPERDYETAHAMVKSYIHHVCKTLRPRKSYFVVLDGTDPLWKVRKMRSVQQKKHWSRFLRSAAAPLNFAVEDRVKFIIGAGSGVNAASAVAADQGASQTSPTMAWLQELVVSGPSTPGPVECKISQWMLDLAARAEANAAAYEHFCAVTPLPKADAGGAANAGGNSMVTPAAFAGQQQLMQKRQAQVLTHAAMFPGVTRGDSIAFVGQADNFPQVMAMTPFLNCALIQLEKSDLRAQYVRQMVEWHGFADLWEAGDNAMMARARTDIVLMRLLTGGLDATSLPTVPGLKLEDMLDAYHALLWPNKKFLTRDDTTNSSASSSSPSSALCIDTSALEILLSRTGNVKASSPGARFSDPIAADYLEILCQSLCALCDGGIKNYGFVPKTNFDIPPPVVPGQAPAPHQGLQLHQLVFHLRALAGSGRPLITASVDPAFALTPAEMLLTSSLEARWISELLPAYTNGHPLPPNIAESIVANKNVRDAYTQAQYLLRLVVNKHVENGTAFPTGAPPPATYTKTQSQMLHRALYHCPTHVWTRKAGTPGPPAGFVYRSVNLGEAARLSNIRAAANSADGFGVGAENAMSKQVAYPIVYHDAATNRWVECADEEGLPRYLYRGAPPAAASGSGEAAPQMTLMNRTESPGTFTVVNWNVQFNRYSGKQTPLGKPGIDWCSATRYGALEKVLATTDADIICMQEVEEPFWAALSRAAWVKEKYVFSTASKGKSINPWGSMMLINRRVPVLRQGLLSMSAGTSHVSWMPTITVQLSDSRALTVACCHLLAPYSQNNIQQREKQILTLLKNLSPKTIGEDVVLMGDFNDYPSNFFVMPERMQFRDSWVEVHGSNDGDAGWTINGRRNTYTALLIEEEFYGRADRVLVKSAHLAAKKAELIGTTSVRAMLGVDTIKDYLFPSDHFGVRVTFDLTDK